MRVHDADTIDSTRLRGGMQVFGAAGKPLGAIERFDDAELVVQGQQVPLALIDRIEGDRIYLGAQSASPGAVAAGAGAASGATRSAAGGRIAPATGAGSERVVDRAGEVRVPVVEERVEVEKRPVELGAVEVRTTVETERQTVPVELEREEVRVRQEEVPARPATDDADDAFQDGTIHVPVRGEESVTRKETVVTGEVVIDKQRTTETQEVAETVRRSRVEVDEDAAGPRPRPARPPGRPRPGPRRALGPSASVVSGYRTWPRGRRWSAPTGPPWAGSRRCGTATSWSIGAGSGTSTSRSRPWRRSPPGGCVSPFRPTRWTTRAGPTRRSCNALGSVRRPPYRLRTVTSSPLDCAGSSALAHTPLAHRRSPGLAAGLAPPRAIIPP